MSFRRAIIGLFLFLTGFFLLTSGGHLYVKDGCTMFFMSDSIINHGWFDVPDNVNTWGGKIGRDGLYYMPFGILQPLLSIPFIFLGRSLQSFSGAYYTASMAVTWLNAILTALIACVMSLFLKELDVSKAWSILIGAATVLSTPFWVYSQTFFSEPLATLFILSSARDIYLYGTSGNYGRLIRSGSAAGLMLLIRPLAGAALPVLFLYLILVESRRSQRTGKAPSLRSIFLFVAMVSVGIMLMLLYNVIRFDSIFETGYDKLPSGTLRSFTLNPAFGLVVLLFSPGKSLFIFAPLSLMALTGLFIGIKNRQWRPEILLSFLMMGIFLTVLCRWARVEGGVTWGPRLILPAIPVFFLGLLPFFRSKPSRFVKTSFCLLFFLGIAIQFLGTAVNFSTFISRDFNAYFDQNNGDYVLSFNPIPGHFTFLKNTINNKEALERYPVQQSNIHRQCLQMNYSDGLDFWWIYTWRDMLNPHFILALATLQLFLLFTGLYLLMTV